MSALLSTISAPVVVETLVKRSRFIARVAPVSTPAEADSVITAVRKEYWNASHHCVAMVMGDSGETQRSSDDGEPSGTAGVPMLEVLRQREVTKVVAVVTRYFGGVKLGAGGLVRAYGSAVAAALDAATLLRRRTVCSVSIAVPHADAGRFDNWMREWVRINDGAVGETSYHHDAEFEVMVPMELVEQFDVDVAAMSAGLLMPVRGQERIVTMR
ncbi:MAG: YigZ family protein [Cellulomonadaceae bacterium]|nr:YigZ family protein [Cellulomonadaceae bacterium]